MISGGMENWMVALLIFGAVAIVSWRSRQSKQAAQANPARWDRYTTPF